MLKEIYKRALITTLETLKKKLKRLLKTKKKVWRQPSIVIETGLVEMKETSIVIETGLVEMKETSLVIETGLVEMKETSNKSNRNRNTCRFVVTMRAHISIPPWSRTTVCSTRWPSPPAAATPSTPAAGSSPPGWTPSTRYPGMVTQIMKGQIILSISTCGRMAWSYMRHCTTPATLRSSFWTTFGTKAGGLSSSNCGGETRWSSGVKTAAPGLVGSPSVWI